MDRHNGTDRRSRIGNARPAAEEVSLVEHTPTRPDQGTGREAAGEEVRGRTVDGECAPDGGTASVPSDGGMIFLMRVGTGNGPISVSAVLGFTL